MILPNEKIKPVDSLFCISAYVIEAVSNKELTVDQILDKVNKSYPKPVSIETLFLCFNYLFIVGKLEESDGLIKIRR